MQPTKALFRMKDPVLLNYIKKIVGNTEGNKENKLIQLENDWWQLNFFGTAFYVINGAPNTVAIQGEIVLDYYLCIDKQAIGSFAHVAEHDINSADQYDKENLHVLSFGDITLCKKILAEVLANRNAESISIAKEAATSTPVVNEYMLSTDDASLAKLISAAEQNVVFNNSSDQERLSASKAIKRAMNEHLSIAGRTTITGLGAVGNGVDAATKLAKNNSLVLAHPPKQCIVS
jgi:hypothetical protein